MTYEELTTRPKDYLEICGTAAEAESLRDWNEIVHEFACRIVTYKGTYYVVWAD